jgi:hypothetical protein
MFYCEPCRKKNDWPESWSKSQGACEMCNKLARCNDVPSSALPMPTRRVRVVKSKKRVVVARQPR